MASQATKRRPIIIEAGRDEANYWRDLWAFRDLAFVMAWRDITVRFKQSVLGLLWAVIRPLVTMIVGLFVFGKLAGFESSTLGYSVDSYALFIFAGNMPWMLVTTGMMSAAAAFTRDAGLIRKVFYPRVISPISSLAVALADFVIGFVMFLLLLLFLGYMPTIHLLALPFFLLLGGIQALGTGLLLGTLNVRFRDVSQIIPYLIQIGLFLTPIMYPLSAIGDRFGDAAKLIYMLNPMVGIVEGCRWAMLGGGALDPIPVGISLLFGVVILFVGHRLFRGAEKGFADVV